MSKLLLFNLAQTPGHSRHARELENKCFAGGDDSLQVLQRNGTQLKKAFRDSVCIFMELDF